MRRSEPAIFTAAFFAGFAVFAFLAVLAMSGGAEAAQGDCGQPLSDGTKPSASDALSILRSAVGDTSCALCICDVNGSSSLSAADSLITLKKAVGQPVGLDCPPCGTSVEKVIGSAGGSITSGDERITVTFPAGALAGDTTISIQSAELASLPDPFDTIDDSEAAAYDVSPGGLDLATAAVVKTELDEDPLATEGRFGANIAILASADGSDAGVLPDQHAFFDGDARTVEISASMPTLATVVLIPSEINVRLEDVPEALGIGGTATIAAKARETDDALDLKSASYIDDDFGSFQPTTGDHIVADLAKNGQGTFEGSFGYTCTGQAQVYYSPRFELVFDIDAGSLHLDGVEQTTELRKTIACGL